MSFWLHFFREAGIPPSPAKSYATTFEDNRISKDMLLDLNKEILNDMGIRVMGDIICILKHAKKVHHSLKLSHTTSPTAVTTTSVLQKRSRSQGQDSEPVLPIDYPSFAPPPLDGCSDHRTELAAGHHYRGGGGGGGVRLKSDSILAEPSYQEPPYYREDTSPGPLAGNTGGQMEFLESYTTAAYEESSRQKRAQTMYSDDQEDFAKTTASKVPKVASVPVEVSELEVAAIQAILESTGNRKLLEAAGLMPVQKSKVSSSVFSRLETPPKVRVKCKSSEGATAQPQGAKNLEGPSKRIKITKPVGERTSAVTTSGLKITSGGASRSAKRSLSPPLKLSVSSAASGRVSERLGKERVLTSSLRSLAAQSSVPVRERLSLPSDVDRRTSSQGKEEVVRIKKRLSVSPPKDRLSSRPPPSNSLSSLSGGMYSRLSGRLGSQEKGNYVSTTSSSSQRSQGGRLTKSSMVADEYESLRQTDIRSRMEHKEKVKRLRREGPLAGRLAKPNVFGRLE